MSGTQVTSKVEDGAVRQSLKKIGDAIPRIGRRQMKRVIESAKYEASGGWNGGSSYSLAGPEKPSYERTGTYGESFEVVDNGGLSYTLKSDAVQRGQHYTSLVGGNYEGLHQAWMHVGRWPLIGPTVTKWINTLVQEIEVEIGYILRQEGMGL